jgi:hypothetical protein
MLRSHSNDAKNMKINTILFALALFLCCQSTHAQTKIATNIVARPNADKSTVVITYDLPINNKIKCYEVQLFIVVDGVAVKSPLGLVGEVGKCVYGGPGKRVVWVVKKDLPTGLGQDLKVEINATPIERCDPKRKAPAYSAFLPPIVIGAGSMYIGLSEWKKSKNLYRNYKKYVNPNDIFYVEGTTSRADLYANANKKYFKGQVFTYAGAGVTALSGFLLLNKLKKIKKHNAKCASLGLSSNQRQWHSFEPVAIAPNIGLFDGGLGFSANFQF